MHGNQAKCRGYMNYVLIAINVIFNIFTKVFNVRQRNIDRLHVHMWVVTEPTSSQRTLTFINTNRTIFPISCFRVIHFLQFVYSQARRQGVARGAW